MTYNELMSEFGKSVGLDDFVPNDDGVCEIYSEEGTVTFQYIPEGDVVLMTGPVCALGSDPSAQFYRTFLEANCMYQKTRGSTLSVDASSNLVILSRYDRLGDLTVERLRSTVEAFATALIEWRTWQKEAQDKAERTASASNAEAFGGIRV